MVRVFAGVISAAALCSEGRYERIDRTIARLLNANS
jgi:hypothetical protein